MRLRPKCWFCYSGASQLATEEPGLFLTLSYRETLDRQSGYTKSTNKVLEFIEIIDRDIHRTFPNHPKFSQSSEDREYSLLKQLRKILVAFAYYSCPHPDKNRKLVRTCSYEIGYCQGLNFIVGFLLLVFTHDIHQKDYKSMLEAESKVFWTLIAIVEQLLPAQIYGQNLQGAQIQQEILWSWIVKEHGESFGMADFSDWLKGMGRSGNVISSLHSITTPWLMNLFINVFPTDVRHEFF